MSSLRHKLAAMITTAFKEQFNMAVSVDPANLHPAMGAWRTNEKLDVYRWEGSALWQIDENSCLLVSVDSWDTMTDLVRHGLLLRKERSTSFEAERRSK